MAYTVDEWSDYQVMTEEDMRHSAREWVAEGVDFNHFVGDNDTFGESPSIHPVGDDGVGYCWLERELETIWKEEGGVL